MRIDLCPEFKTGRDYAVPMNEDIRSVLQQIRNITRGSYIFLNPDTTKPYTDIKKAFGTPCQLAGVETYPTFWVGSLLETSLAMLCRILRETLIVS